MHQVDDPVTLVYDALVKGIAERPKIKKLVKDKNIVSFTDSRNETPLKKNIGVGDLPEIQVWAETSGAGFVSSDSVMLETSYTAVIVTGSYLLHQRVLPIQFEVFCAWVDWRRYLKNLTWDGRAFVEKVTLDGFQVGEGDAQKNRGIAGWVSLARLRVRMSFQMSSLQLGG